MQVTKIVKSEEGEVVNLSRPQTEPLTSRKEQSYFVLKGTIPPGINVPLHSHGDPESFYVLSGGSSPCLNGSQVGMEDCPPGRLRSYSAWNKTRLAKPIDG
jgi:hypothetical protein